MIAIGLIAMRTIRLWISTFASRKWLNCVELLQIGWGREGWITCSSTAIIVYVTQTLFIANLVVEIVNFLIRKTYEPVTALSVIMFSIFATMFDIRINRPEHKEQPKHQIAPLSEPCVKTYSVLPRSSFHRRFYDVSATITTLRISFDRFLKKAKFLRGELIYKFMKKRSERLTV